MGSQEIARKISQIIAEHQGENIVLLGLKEVSLLTDYFVICSGQSRRHTQAIADYVEEAMAKAQVPLERQEGYVGGRWILLDFGEVIVHIFEQEERQIYNLEKLWEDGLVIQL